MDKVQLLDKLKSFDVNKTTDTTVGFSNKDNENVSSVNVSYANSSSILSIEQRLKNIESNLNINNFVSTSSETNIVDFSELKRTLSKFQNNNENLNLNKNIQEVEMGEIKSDEPLEKQFEQKETVLATNNDVSNLEEIEVEDNYGDHFNKVDDGNIPDISLPIGVHSGETIEKKGIAGLMNVTDVVEVPKDGFVKAKAFGKKDRDRESNVEVKLNYAELELSKKQIKEFEKSMTASEKKTLSVEEQEARLRLFLLREKAIDEKDKKAKMEERRLTRVKEYDDFIIRQNESHIVGFKRKG